MTRGVLLCDNVKSKVCTGKSRTPVVLKDGTEIGTTPCDVSWSVVIENWARWVDECVEKEGRRLTTIVFQNDLFL